MTDAAESCDGALRQHTGLRHVCQDLSELQTFANIDDRASI